MFKFSRRSKETREIPPPSNVVEQLARVLAPIDCKWEQDGYSRFKKCLQPYSTKISQLYLKRPAKVAGISYKETLAFANGSNLTIGLVREADQIKVIGFHDVPAKPPNGKTYANCGIKSHCIGHVPNDITALILQSGMFGDILPRLVRIYDSPLPIKHGAKSDCDLLAAVYLELIKEIDLGNNFGNREIILDIETTGLSPKDDRIVEIACVELSGHIPTGRYFQRYVNPCRDVPPRVRHIHGLTEEFLAPYPPFISIVDDLLAFIGQTPLVSHSDLIYVF